MSDGVANGAKTAIRKSCERQVAGAIDTSRRRRVRMSETAKASAVRSDSASPVRLPPPGAPTMSVTPARATTMAIALRRLTGSPRNTRPSSAASTGAMARKNRTRATEVWLSAAMNPPDATAMQAATATPASPIERHAAITRPRSATATNAASATKANTARPATCVAVSIESPRCSTPAVDHAIAASAT